MKYLLLFLLIPINGWALVDVQNWTYQEDWQDLPDVVVNRQYQAKVQGIFGTNWCSWLDLKSPCAGTKVKQKSSAAYQVTFDEVTYNLLVVNNQVISFGDGVTFFNVTYNDQGLVSKLINDHYQATFTYKQGLLISVKNAYQNVYNYEYNDKNRLTKILYPDKTAKVIFYDQDGQVVKFQSQKNCLETYQTLPNRDRSVVKVCAGQETARKRYTFADKKIVKYVSQTANGIVIAEYNLNCQKIKKINRRDKAVFSDLTYTYNDKCQVVKVVDDIQKQNYAVAYDKVGNIKTISQNQKTLTLEYNEFGKPVKLKHPKWGISEIIYSNKTHQILEVYPLNMAMIQELQKVMDLMGPSNQNP